MNLDITIHKGRTDRPVIIFIHGLGVDKGFWTDPVNTKVLGGSIPMKTFAATKPQPLSTHNSSKITVGDMPSSIENLWTATIKKGFNAICWSQARPVGPINIAVSELHEIFIQTKKLFTGKSVVLVGHSRGGLIARKFMENIYPEIKGLITIATPHDGSSLSHIGKYLTPLAPAVKKILPVHAHGTAADILKRINDLLDGTALKELLPGSAFFKTLNDSSVPGISYLSFGGTTTKLLTIYVWSRKENTLYPKPVITIPDSLMKIIPSKIIPDEIISGKGDFMVTAKSAVMPWSSNHINVRSDHIAISWNKTVINKTIELIDKI